ncbi:hypothetical protein ACFOWT_09815 [Croceibacterium xixiisoli]|nr:hypothetical protein [Croceibacterium xixiisoli]
MAGDVEIDLVNRRVLKGDVDVHLTPKEYSKMPWPGDHASTADERCLAT